MECSIYIRSISQLWNSRKKIREFSVKQRALDCTDWRISFQWQSNWPELHLHEFWKSLESSWRHYQLPDQGICCSSGSYELPSKGQPVLTLNYCCLWSKSDNQRPAVTFRLTFLLPNIFGVWCCLPSLPWFLLPSKKPEISPLVGIIHPGIESDDKVGRW